ncbi:MAG: hypothetical protein HQM06_16710 [Magnetococcales bacterium]|nr:hypothetical protein [Magnetococcales bacterium]
MSGSGLLLSGDVYVNRINADGSTSGWMPLGNTKKLQVTEKVKQINRTSTSPGSYGAVLDSVQVPEPVEIDINTDDFNPEMLALMFRGDADAFSEPAGSGVIEMFVATPGRGHKLAHFNLGSELVVQHVNGVNAVTWSASTAKIVGDCVRPTVANGHYYRCIQAGTTTSNAEPNWPVDGGTVLDDGTAHWQDMGLINLAMGRDFVVDFAAGMITPALSGQIASGEALRVTYDHLAMTGSRIKGGIRPSIRASVLLQGINLASGKPVRLEIPQTSLFPAGGVDLITENFAGFAIKGNPTKIDGYEAPYTLTLL